MNAASLTPRHIIIALASRAISAGFCNTGGGVYAVIAHYPGHGEITIGNGEWNSGDLDYPAYEGVVYVKAWHTSDESYPDEGGRECRTMDEIVDAATECAWWLERFTMSEPTLFDIDPQTPAVPVHSCLGVSCGFCLSWAEVKAAAAMQDAETHANALWIRSAEETVYLRASIRRPFTTDDVMDDLSAAGIFTHDPRALGPVVRRMIRLGVITEDGMARSRRRHGARIPIYVGAR